MTRIACVTGADRGLGLALAKTLLEQGERVIAGRYGAEDNEQLRSLRAQYGERLLIAALDVSSAESVKAAAQAITAYTDRIDVLINNAAILGDITSTADNELDYADMLRVYDINALGPLRVGQALLPLLLRSTHKLIVNISSEAGSIGDCDRRGWFAYSMSKAALNMQTALLHNHLRDAGGAVVSVHPGWVQTYMQGRLDESATYTPDESARHIITLIRQPERFRADKPVFTDLHGQPLPW